MSVLVTYSSLTDNTKRLAEGIFAALPGEGNAIRPVKEVTDVGPFDTVLVGSYITAWEFSPEANRLLDSLEGKKVGLFATLTYWPDSDDARKAINSAAAHAAPKNKVIAKYIVQGKLAPKLAETFKSRPAGDRYAYTPEMERRFAVAANHPSNLEIQLGGQFFAERLAADIETSEI
jgi:menaquinone-dependent protoporphyrinogen IX oxidase